VEVIVALQERGARSAYHWLEQGGWPIRSFSGEELVAEEGRKESYLSADGQYIEKDWKTVLKRTCQTNGRCFRFNAVKTRRIRPHHPPGIDPS